MATSSEVNLPIHNYKDSLVKSITDSRSLVVVGETGSGKTTQLPQFLYDSGFSKHGVIGVTQPRRVAAMSVAARVAEEMGCRVGDRVGYQVRFDDCTSDETAIKYMTDGCLLREFLRDGELSQYSVIVLDEAHERSLDTDILFGLVKQLFLSDDNHSSISKRQQPLKVVIMSATLDQGKFSQFLGGCPVFEIPGRLHPVKEIYCGLVEEKDMGRNATVNYVSKVVDTVMEIHLEQKKGDILVFLTGQVEIEQCCDKLFRKSEQVDYRHDVRDRSVQALMVLPVYGSMPTELQKRIFAPAEDGVRKCVVATNIAGTSLTIDGIRYVVDSGFVKQMSYNPRTGLDALQVVPISRAEAIQRAGRAGRTAPGKCYRIYSEGFYDNCMTEDMIPEIQRTSLTSVVLSLKCMGIHNILHFPFVDQPEERMLLEALRQLYYYGAIDKNGTITSLGRQIVEYPLSPGLARSLIYSGAMGCKDLMLPIAAMLSVENVFVRPGDPTKQAEASKAHRKLADKVGGSNDFATLLTVFQKCSESESPSNWCRKHSIHWRGVKTALSVHRQLEIILEHQMEDPDFPSVEMEGSSSERLRRVLCAGFFGNVARKSPSGHGYRTMEGHGTVVFVHPSSCLFSRDEELDWVIYHEVLLTSKVFMRTVCPIKYEWVKDLLPRLHEMDAYALSGCLAPSTDGDSKSSDHRGKRKGQDADCSEPKDKSFRADADEESSKGGRRNDQAAVSDAKQRYLERKLAKAKR
ncbi:probable ATP-dependent RNA helicase DHX40 [Diadema setosum]|uniref:probable ATP-dependent RNA helicase DHX40 n=1 Tax=Diadema setosum TaxID=31175 RepID=UPI003B3BA4E0